MAVEQTIRGMFPGEDKALVIDVEEDCSGWTVVFVMVVPDGDGITKTNGSGLTVGQTAPSGANHGIRVVLEAADTLALAEQGYAWTVRRTDPGANAMVALGQLILGPAKGTYSSPAAVIARTGITPKDLGYADDDALDAFLTDTLAEITDLMNARMRRDYLTDGPVPAGVNGIAADIAAESVRQMVQTRETPTVRIDDFAIRMVTSRVFTPDIMERLKLYGRGAVTIAVGHGDLRGEPWFGDVSEILNGG